MPRLQLTSAPEVATAVEGLVRVSRALGADPNLVLHGGGNTSVKTVTTDITGHPVPTIFVKASGHDLATIDQTGFAPLRLERLREILPPVVVPDDELMNELRCALLDAQAPDPSVETLVHALLPHPAVVHSHADALLTVANTPEGGRRLRQLFGPRVVVVEYAMPGPDLVAACAAGWAEHGGPDVLGLAVLGHGLFTVGDTPDEAYRRHLDLVAEAADIVRRTASSLPTDPVVALPEVDPVALATLRRRISDAAGHPMIVSTHRDARWPDSSRTTAASSPPAAAR